MKATCTGRDGTDKTIPFFSTGKDPLTMYQNFGYELHRLGKLFATGLSGVCEPEGLFGPVSTPDSLTQEVACIRHHFLQRIFGLEDEGSVRRYVQAHQRELVSVMDAIFERDRLGAFPPVIQTLMRCCRLSGDTFPNTSTRMEKRFSAALLWSGLSSGTREPENPGCHFSSARNLDYLANLVKQTSGKPDGPTLPVFAGFKLKTHPVCFPACLSYEGLYGGRPDPECKYIGTYPFHGHFVRDEKIREHFCGKLPDQVLGH